MVSFITGTVFPLPAPCSPPESFIHQAALMWPGHGELVLLGRETQIEKCYRVRVSRYCIYHTMYMLIQQQCTLLIKDCCQMYLNCAFSSWYPKYPKLGQVIKLNPQKPQHPCCYVFHFAGIGSISWTVFKNKLLKAGRCCTWMSEGEGTVSAEVERDVRGPPCA